MLKIEKLETDLNGKIEVYRAKVPGGWLLFYLKSHSSVFDDAGYAYGYGGSTFYPDPDHLWDGSSLD